MKEAAPEIVSLQELKAPQDKFPQGPIPEAGYGAIWHGQKGWHDVAILARDTDPIETRRGLPGDTEDSHSRYVEATVRGLLVGCLYVPNGNPVRAPKFEYKLRWFDRLMAPRRKPARVLRPRRPRRRLQRHAHRSRSLQTRAVAG